VSSTELDLRLYRDLTRDWTGPVDANPVLTGSGLSDLTAFPSSGSPANDIGVPSPESPSAIQALPSLPIGAGPAAPAPGGVGSTGEGLVPAGLSVDPGTPDALHFGVPLDGVTEPLTEPPTQTGVPAQTGLVTFETMPVAVAPPPAPPMVALDRIAGPRSEAASTKLDGFLGSLLSDRSARGTVHPMSLPGSVGGQYVTIDATAKDGNGGTLLAELQLLGLKHGAAFGGMASGELPIAKLGALQGLSDLSFAHEDALVTHKVSPLPPQVAEALGTTASGVTVTTPGGLPVTIDGTGVTVGILSDSFNTAGLADTMQTDIKNGYLPADTHILQDFSGGSDEGRALAQIVHEVAPGASILFATAFAGEASFANNIIALAKAGAKVIIDDVGYFDEPAYQDGVIAQAVDYVTTHYGVAYYSAAGNDGSNGYEGAFTRGIHAYGRIFNNFTPGRGQHDAIPVTIPAGDEVVFVLEWAQPAASASPGRGATGRLDLILVNAAGTRVAISQDRTVGHDPFQGIDFVNHLNHARTLYLEVGWKAGVVPKDFKLMALDNGGGVKLGSFGTNHNDGTIYGHPAAAGGVAVGADFIGDTPAFGTNPPLSEYYSSTGPTNIYFQPNGLPFGSPVVRPGPGLMAPDGGDTSFLGFQIQDGDTLPNFFGTSASVAAAGGVAALVLEADPLLTAGESVHLMQTTALHQPDSVAGLIQADVAVNAAWYDFLLNT
jgi:hypothetical protein